MKKTMILLYLASIGYGAFTQNNHNDMDHSKMSDKTMVSNSIEVKYSKLVTPILDNYLSLKNALADDNSVKAADAGEVLFDIIAKFDLSTQPKTKQQELAEIIENAKENAEHISENRGEIDHQREHFEILSNDINDLVIITGSDRDLYKIFCPMYNNKKGGIWLNESEAIMNPLLGKKMSKCGTVKQIITIK